MLCIKEKRRKRRKFCKHGGWLTFVNYYKNYNTRERIYDDVYAISKMLIHSYVENKELKPMQQIVAISPGIIEDAGMTTRRKDLKTLAFRKAQHPMRRFLRAREVAELAHHLLYHQPYIRNTVIRMHGGLK